MYTFDKKSTPAGSYTLRLLCCAHALIYILSASLVDWNFEPHVVRNMIKVSSTNEELYGVASLIRQESNEVSQFLAISYNARGLNEVSLPLARMLMRGIWYTFK